MPRTQEIIEVLSEATVIRLYNMASRNENQTRVASFRQTQIQAMEQISLESIKSSNDFNTSCRICRWNRSDMEIIKCPCQCKGSVGFIHLPCLKRWIMHRRDDHCEICNSAFAIPEEKLSIRRMVKTFFSHCAGPLLKHLLFAASLLPLTHVILQQVVICMENININPNQDLTMKQVFMAVTTLMTSSALFFHFFEFITTRLIIIGNIFKHWWSFGHSTDFTLISVESNILNIFN